MLSCVQAPTAISFSCISRIKMERNLLSCPFFLLLFLQGRALQSRLGVGRDTRGGACTSRSLNGSALGEPRWGCTAGYSDRFKYLYNMVPVHPQDGEGLRAVELPADVPPNGHTRTSWAP